MQNSSKRSGGKASGGKKPLSKAAKSKEKHVSRTGRRNNNKRNGGGKSSWGTPDMQDGPASLGKGDPNYDSSEE